MRVIPPTRSPLIQIIKMPTKGQLFILYLFCLSCVGRQQSDVPVEALKTNALIDSNKSIDTIFIKRQVSDGFYHAIYIDTSRTSPYYDRLADVEFDEDHLNVYNGSCDAIKAKNPDAFRRVSETELVEHWVPVYSYKSHYYVYAPADWGNVGRLTVNDSAFVYWQMDGPMPIPLSTVRRVDDGKTIIEMAEPSRTKLTIHQIDKDTGLSVFEFQRDDAPNEYRLYAPAENAKKFDIVVNYCNKGKQLEFDFDKIDVVGLIE